MFSLDGKVAVVTGGTGVLGGAVVGGLVGAGARVVLLGRSKTKVDRLVAAIKAKNGQALGVQADVLAKPQLEAARDQVLGEWGKIDILVNMAGGNLPGATLDASRTFFDLPEAALRDVVDLNFLGTLLPSQVFGGAMVTSTRPASGCIVNVSSMAAPRAMTRVVGYGAAKSAVDNFTRWSAVELAKMSGGGIRVNAIAPGFFIGEQNRALLLNDDGSLTERGQLVIDHTPAGRFGEPEELVSTVVWLCGPGARFVNGVVVPIDGGFSAFSGV
ncbi:MAG: SDR family oxidoreductase [Chloroflexia bacterium]|nr:SDR family oxidoreductase [Chloroflexia bacterium]